MLLSLLQAVHRELFQFDITVSDETLYDAVSNSHWLCLAAVQPQASGEEQLVGFVMSAVGSASDFEQGVSSALVVCDQPLVQCTHNLAVAAWLLACPLNSSAPALCLLQDYAGSGESSSSGSGSAAKGMGLQHLSVKPDDVVSRVAWST